MRKLLIASVLCLPLAWNTVSAKPKLELEAQAYTEVEQDTVIITLQATKQSSEQQEVSQYLSDTVAAVLDEAKQQEAVKVSSGNYSVRPQQNKEGDITGWKGQSQLLFESTDMSAASKLAAKYQDSMPVANVSFTVSKSARLEAEQQLMEDVAEAFNQRAQTMSQALGYKNFEIKKMQLGSSGAMYRSPQAYSDAPMLKAASAEALPISSGTEDISLSLRGEVYLRDKK